MSMLQGTFPFCAGYLRVTRVKPAQNRLGIGLGMVNLIH